MKEKISLLKHKYNLKKILISIIIFTGLFLSINVVVTFITKLSMIFVPISYVSTLTLSSSFIIYLLGFIIDFKILIEGIFNNKIRKGLFLFNNKVMDFNNKKIKVINIEQNPFSKLSIKNKIFSIFSKKNNLRNSFNFLTKELYDVINELEDNKIYGCNTHSFIIKLLDKLEQLGYIKNLDYCCSLKTTNLSHEKRDIGNKDINKDNIYVINAIFKKGDMDIKNVSYSQLMHEIRPNSNKLKTFLLGYKNLNENLKNNKKVSKDMVDNFNDEFIKYKKSLIEEKMNIKKQNNEIKKSSKEKEIENLLNIKNEINEYKYNEEIENFKHKF